MYFKKSLAIAVKVCIIVYIIVTNFLNIFSSFIEYIILKMILFLAICCNSAKNVMQNIKLINQEKKSALLGQIL